MLAYAGRLADGMIADRAVLPGPQSTPLACQTEGLLAYARVLRATGDDGGTARVLKRVAQNLRRQLRFYDTSGAFVHSHAKPEVRIDYMMHNAIGFLGYARQMRDDAIGTAGTA